MYTSKEVNGTFTFSHTSGWFWIRFLNVCVECVSVEYDETIAIGWRTEQNHFVIYTFRFTSVTRTILNDIVSPQPMTTTYVVQTRDSLVSYCSYTVVINVHNMRSKLVCACNFLIASYAFKLPQIFLLCLSNAHTHTRTYVILFRHGCVTCNRRFRDKCLKKRKILIATVRVSNFINNNIWVRVSERENLTVFDNVYDNFSSLLLGINLIVKESQKKKKTHVTNIEFLEICEAHKRTQMRSGVLRARKRILFAQTKYKRTKPIRITDSDNVMWNNRTYVCVCAVYTAIINLSLVFFFFLFC